LDCKSRFICFRLLQCVVGPLWWAAPLLSFSRNGYVNITDIAAAAPEPGSIVLLSLGLVALAFATRRSL